MRIKRQPRDIWLVITVAALAFYALFLLYPLVTLLSKSFMDKGGALTMANFQRFFSKKYYFRALFNSFAVTSAITLFCVLLATPLAYIMSMYRIRFQRALEILILISSMSAPFIGAYSWIMLFGRSGSVTTALLHLTGLKLPDIYGFWGIVLVMSLQLYSLVYMFVSGAFKNMDSSLLEASESLGVKGLGMIRRVVLPLIMPTLLAGALMVFMRTFADYGTPRLIGEGYMTMPVLVYNEFMSETGGNDGLAAAISIIAVIITTAVFLIQKLVVNRKQFSMNALHPIHKKPLRGASNWLAHLYCYLLVFVAMLPQLYVVYSSFRNTSGKLYASGYGLGSYIEAFRTVGKSIANTYLLGLGSIAAIVLIAILIAYVVVRRRSLLTGALDVVTMFPETVAGSILGIALLMAFSRRPLLLSGGAFIMVLAFTLRRMPYTVRSTTATLRQISPSVEEAAISLGASDMKTFFRVTVPMMLPGVLSGAILSFIMIITELSTSIILYTTNTKTMTLEIYSQIIRGNDGVASAISSILTLSTVVALALFFKVSGKGDVQL